MKNIVLEFFRRGFIACGFGPIVLAVLYLVLVIAAKLCPHCGKYGAPIFPWKKDLGYCRKYGKKIEYDC